MMQEMPRCGIRFGCFQCRFAALMPALGEGVGVEGARRTAETAALMLVDGATPLRAEPALFEAMLEGWRRQQVSRRLGSSIIDRRERVVRRFAAFTQGWPWRWREDQVEAWSASGGWAHSSVRSYQSALACFLAFVCDPRYGWVAECERRVGAAPRQVCHEWNTAIHVADYEGRPQRRPLSRAELQAFFDVGDDRVERAGRSGRKGWWRRFAIRRCSRWSTGGGCGGPRRRCLISSTCPPTRRRRSWVGWGVSCPLRQGDAWSPPRRRAVATVMPWAVEALEQYLAEVRPRYGCVGASGAVVDRAGRADLGAAGRRPVRRVPGGGRAAG